MVWLRRGTLVIAVGIGLFVLALVVHTFWIASQNTPFLLGQKVQSLQLLVIVLLAVLGLYTVTLLLSPSMSERILKQTADQAVNAIRAQLSSSVADLRELKDEIRQTMSGQGNAVISGREYLNVSGGLRTLKSELIQIYQALASLSVDQDPVSAKAYLNQALALNIEPGAAAEIHYALACLLSQHDEPGEAMIELQTAFMDKTPALERKLAKDTEEGGPLYGLATREPYQKALDDLLMDVSVGK